MRLKQFMRAALCSFALLITTALPVSAEWLADLYLGPAFTSNDKVSGVKVRFDNVFSFGGRVGHYFESLPYLGLAFDVSHYQPDGSAGGQSFDAKVTGLSFDAMLRLPLFTGKDFPHGQLQPYLTLGPGVYFAKASGSGLSGSDTGVGVKAGAGASWMFTRNIGVFGEYRFSHFTAKDSGTEVDLDTSRLQFGATFRF